MGKKDWRHSKDRDLEGGEENQQLWQKGLKRDRNHGEGAVDFSGVNTSTSGGIDELLSFLQEEGRYGVRSGGRGGSR